MDRESVHSGTAVRLDHLVEKQPFGMVGHVVRIERAVDERRLRIGGEGDRHLVVNRFHAQLGIRGAPLHLHGIETLNRVDVVQIQFAVLLFKPQRIGSQYAVQYLADGEGFVVFIEKVVPEQCAVREQVSRVSFRKFCRYVLFEGAVVECRCLEA